MLSVCSAFFQMQVFLTSEQHIFMKLVALTKAVGAEELDRRISFGDGADQLMDCMGGAGKCR